MIVICNESIKINAPGKNLSLLLDKFIDSICILELTPIIDSQ